MAEFQQLRNPRPDPAASPPPAPSGPGAGVPGVPGPLGALPAVPPKKKPVSTWFTSRSALQVYGECLLLPPSRLRTAAFVGVNANATPPCFFLFGFSDVHQPGRRPQRHAEQEGVFAVQSALADHCLRGPPLRGIPHVQEQGHRRNGNGWSIFFWLSDVCSLSRLLRVRCARHRLSHVRRRVQDYKTYLDFVLAMENKTTPQSIQYFWKILDVNRDGYVTVFTLNYFFRVRHIRHLFFFWP